MGLVVGRQRARGATVVVVRGVGTAVELGEIFLLENEIFLSVFLFDGRQRVDIVLKKKNNTVPVIPVTLK